MGYRKILASTLVAFALVSCGGGGGSPGLPVAIPATGVAGAGTESTAPPVATASVAVDVLGGTGTSATSISAIEIAQVKALVKDAAGAVVPGTIVTFSEASGTLLAFAPTSKTALTDSTGTALVEVRAASIANLGATSIVATALVGSATVAGQKAISISSAPAVGTVDPQVLATAINFLDVNPSDRSIVLAGSGGNGRSESASLRFRIVDANNSPVKGTSVTFSVTPPGDVTLNIPTAKSDTDGVVVTTVSSKSVATAVVVRATVDGKGITTQSDQLLVTTGVATQAGFDMSASKYNLTSNKTGDLSLVTVRIRDANGNPVTDGVPVVFTADYGAVGSSTRGGCVTSGGGCSVDFLVQDPRPADGVLTTVLASTRVGDGTTISKTLKFRLIDMGLIELFDASTGGAVVTTVNATSCAAQTFSAFAGTPQNFPVPGGTTVTVRPISSGLTASLRSPTPIADILGTAPGRASVDFEANLAALTGAPCTGPGTSGTTGRAFFDVDFTSQGITRTRRVAVNYAS